MDWIQLETEVRELSQKIDSRIDILVGIVRGGVIPARLLSTYLRIKPMYCINVQKVGDERKVTTDILEDLVGKKILLIEDMLETGKSLIIARQYLESKGAHVKTACLYTMSISEITPDYSLRQVTEVEKFPWE